MYEVYILYSCDYFQCARLQILHLSPWKYRRTVHGLYWTSEVYRACNDKNECQLLLLLPLAWPLCFLNLWLYRRLLQIDKGFKISLAMNRIWRKCVSYIRDLQSRSLAFHHNELWDNIIWKMLHTFLGSFLVPLDLVWVKREGIRVSHAPSRQARNVDYQSVIGAHFA